MNVSGSTARQTTRTVRSPAPPPVSEDGRRRGTRNWRKSLFRLHGWLGLNGGLLLFVVCFSGSIATISNEIDRMINPAMRAEVRDARYAWTDMHETLRSTFPDGTNLGVYAPVESGFAALAYVALPTGETRKVYLNPYTGALQGNTSFFNVQRFSRSFHRRFFDGYRGITIVTLMGFMLLVSAVSGLLFYRGWIKQLFTLRRRHGRRLLWSDLHKTGGIWVLLFTALIALTGIFYFVEEQMQQSGRGASLLPPPLPEVAPATLEALGSQPHLLPAGAYVEAAKRIFPELEIRSIRMAQSPTDAVYIDGQAGNPLTRDRANKVFLHPFTAEVLAVQRSADLAVVPFITDAVDPLHFGYFGGLPTKLLWLGFGLILSFSILSGTYIWVVRLSSARRGHTSLWLRGAVVSVAVTLAYFALIVFATIEGIRSYGPRQPDPVLVENVAVGPYRISVYCDRPCLPPDGARYRLRFEGEGLPNYASVALTSPGSSTSAPHGPARSPSSTMRSGYGDAVRINVETRGGGKYAGTFRTPQSAVRPAPRPPGLPDVVPGVWWIVAAFTVTTAALIGLWLYFIVRAYRVQAIR